MCVVVRGLTAPAAGDKSGRIAVLRDTRTAFQTDLQLNHCMTTQRRTNLNDVPVL